MGDEIRSFDSVVVQRVVDAELRLLCKPTKDDRTHEDLVNEFLASRNA